MFRNRVTLGIAGTAASSGGLQTLINIDSPLDLKQDPLFNESLGGDFIIELKHTAEYIFLRYLARPDTVHSYGAGRSGRLWIGMTIPRGKRFANDVSPYTVLKDVLETLRHNYMTARGDGSYEFNPGSYLRAPFDDLLENRYPLEDFPGRYVEMTGERQAVVCPVDENAMTRFFADTQYDEFKDVGSVMVSLNQSWSGAGIIKVEIPRPVHFDVFVSSTKYGVLTSPDQRFERTLPPPDDIHDQLHVSFSLSELRKGACCSFAWVDEAKEEIHLYPTFPERSFRLDFDFRSSTGSLSDVSCEPERFYLSASNGVMRKQIQREDGKCFAVFVGSEANEHWEVRYDGEAAASRFDMSVTGLSPKEGRPVTVILTPYAEYQGIKFYGARFLKGDAFLEIVFGNNESFKYPIIKDSSRLLRGRKQSDVQAVRLVSDRYDYPELTRRYDPVSGWDLVELTGNPVLRDKEVSSGGSKSGESGMLVVENRTVELTASLKASFSDGTTLEWGRVRLNRQESGEEKGFILPSPYGKKGLEKVVLSELRDENKRDYPNMDFVISPGEGERSLKELDSQGKYRIVIDCLGRLSFWQRIEEWLKELRVPRWALIAGLLLALAAGVGSCLAWQRYVSPWIPTLHAAVQEEEQQDGSLGEEADQDLYYLAGGVDNDMQNGEQVPPADEEQASARQAHPSSNSYRPRLEDANKIRQYYTLMTKLEADGQPLTFDQVKEIHAFQKRISEEAGGQAVGQQFEFIKKYIGFFSQAVNEIEKIKSGEYSMNCSPEEYYSNSKVLSDISSACKGEELKPFRIAIQKLYITGEADFNDQRKMQFIRRAVLSGASADRAILKDVNSFKGILQVYNNQ